MEIQKPNDILVAVINNPNSSTYDLMSTGLNPDNTSFFKNKDEYKNSNFIKEAFKDESGKFDDIAFDNFYNLAANHYNNMSQEVYLKSLDEVEYSPFDITRPKEAKTFKVSVDFQKEINPFKQVYSRTGVNSIDESPLSLREIAQQEKVYDPESKTWSEQSANDLSLLNKFLGDTLVYAQWDEDGTHLDLESNQVIKHKKGDWKINERGNLYIEKLGKREVYGKQVVNPMDMLTTDGSIANKFDIFDSDSKEKSATKVTFKIAADIAPFLIPHVAPVYGAIKAAIGLASVMPTFFKALDGILNNDNDGGLATSFTAAENYMAKFAASSVTDEGQKSLFTYEQMSQIVGDIFSQIYEQRAAASLSMLFGRGKQAQFTAKQQQFLKDINEDIVNGLTRGKINLDQAEEISLIARAKIPELSGFLKDRSGLSKSFSLGYMALTSTAQVYSEALEGGYDRRTAGFAALSAAAGAYGVMMNNRMGDWFLDEATGYTNSANSAMISKSVKAHLDDIQKAIKDYAVDAPKGKAGLAVAFKGIKNKLQDVFTNPGELRNAMVRNAFIEGVEEVTEQVVLDATKGVFDTMSYLGLVKQKGTFGGFDNVFSREGLQEYLANFMGGILGGAMFEFNRVKIDPWVSGNALPEDTKRSIYQLVANGETEAVINEINRQRKNLGNAHISPSLINGNAAEAEPGQSQADLIADMGIQMVRNIDGIMKAKGLAVSDKDIVKHAMIDHLIIKDLEAARGEDGIGIEGIIIDDFRNAAAEIMRINSDIAKLTEIKENKENKEDSTEELKRLKELSKIHEQTISDIREGKLAGEYFDQVLFYLNKDVSSAFLNLDKITYTKTKYEKNYHDLVEKGMGITKEFIDKEWKDYIDSKDIRKSIKVATKAYLEMEKAMNPTIAKYIDTGYLEERRKTVQNLLDVIKTVNLFNVYDDTKKQITINHYIKVAKQIESLTGQRIIPWDVINTDVADKIIQEELLSSMTSEDGKITKTKPSDRYLNEEIDLNGEKTKRIDIIKDVLNLKLSTLPAEQLSYDMLAEKFNYDIAIYNAKINTKIQELDKEKTSDNKVQIESEIASLESRKINVQLDLYQESELYYRQLEEIAPNLLVKQNELQITQKEIDAINGSSEQELNKSFISYENILKEYSESKDKTVSELTEEEKIEALSEITGIYSAFSAEGELLSELLKSENSNKFIEAEKIINSFIDRRDQLKSKVKEYTDFKSKTQESVKMPEIFNVNNYAIDSIIKEIKSSKNLDKELLLEVEKTFAKLISGLKSKHFKGIEINNVDFLDLIKNVEKIASDMGVYAFDFDTAGDSDVILPDYLSEIINNSNDKEETRDNLLSSISVLSEVIGKDSKTIDKLFELKEVIDNKSNFISNTIYDFLENFELFLSGVGEKTKNTVFSVLKQEELSLFNSSDVTNYSSEELRDRHMQQAINTIEMAKSVLNAMSTTEIDLGDPYGFVMSRQAFAEKYKIKSDVKSLRTITSDNANLMATDLIRIENKIRFLKELARNNAGKIFHEQENTREAVIDLMFGEFKRLKNIDIKINEKPLVPDLEDILSSTEGNDRKVLKIEEAFFEHYRDATLEDKIQAVKELIKEYKYANDIDTLYNSDGDDRISKNIKQLNKNDFLLSLVSSIVINSRDFDNRLLNILNTEFDKSPFFTQELAVKVAYASIVQPELFAEIAQENKDVNAQLTDYITYILGDAGTGKTTVAFKTLVLLLQNNNPNMSIWFAAPHTDQANKLKKEVLEKIDSSKLEIDTTLNKKELFERLGISSIINEINTKGSKLIGIDGNKLTIDFENIVFDIPTDLPNLIFLDEVTHFNAIELAIMNEVVRRARIGTKEKPGLNMRIIGAGDPTQNGSTYINFDELMYNVDRVSGIFTPQLSITVRALNSQKRVNNEHVSGRLKKAISVYQRKEDIPKVMQVIGDGIILKHYLDENQLNGDLLLSSNTIPENILNTLKNIIVKDSTIKIGILSKGLDISTELKESLNKARITEANYTVYTENTVQGSESDYFIFDTDLVKNKNIVRSLRNLYTYMSRAKHGSIILNSGNIVNGDQSTLNIISERQDFTEPIQPLRPEAVTADKEARIASLKALLDPNFNIKYDNFKFNEGEVIIDDDMDDNIFKNIEEVDSKEEQQFLKPEDNFNYRAHTFYNDLNIKYKIKGDKVTLYRNTNLLNRAGDPIISYGLDPVIKWEKGQFEMSLEEFNNLTSKYISLKYAIWNQGLSSKKFSLIKHDFLNEILGDRNTPSRYKTELVLRKDTYFDEFNAPFAKEGDIQKEHLGTGDPYVNLFLKVETNTDSFYYIHLATFPKKETVKAFYDKFVGPDTNSVKAYSEFLINGESEYTVDPSKLLLKTSTRAIKLEGVKTENTLEKLSKIPGLKFYNGTKFTPEISYNLFPTGEAGFNEFKNIYKRHTFGQEISEENLHDMYFGKARSDGTRTPGYKGKPYTIISFTDNLAHAQVILLKSKTRTFKQVLEAIKNPYGSKEVKSAKELIMSSEKGSAERKRIYRFTNTLFSGSQVLDMIINLAADDPKLFNLFYKDGYDLLEKTASDINKSSMTEESKKEFITKYLSVLGQDFEKDLLAHITYASKGTEDSLRRIFTEVKIAVEEYTKSGKEINKQDLKKKLLPIAKNQKLWFRNFWNLFSFRNSLDQIIANKDIFEDMVENYKNFANTIDKMIAYWSATFDDKVYYNVPITAEKKGTYILDKAEWNKQFLYTERVPEGFYLSVDLSNIVNNIVEIDPNKDKIKQLKDTLNKIKYNRASIIKAEDSDNEAIILDKIEKATEIKNILTHDKNSAEFGDIFIKEVLLIKTLNELQDIRRELNIREKDKGNTINNIVSELKEYIRVNKLEESRSYKAQFISTFIERLTKTDAYEQEDLDIVSEIISKWNVKEKGLTILQYLHSLDNSEDALIATLAETEGFDEKYDDLSSVLTNKVYTNYNIKRPTDPNSPLTDLFNIC